jgi:predicted dehydrogenase
MSKVKLAIIGCGGMAGSHVNGLKALWEAGLKDIEVVACCDMAVDKAQAMAKDLAAFQGTTPAVFSDMDEMLAKAGDVNAVDICTLHRNHHGIAKACFEAGKHVTMEKPLALTLRAGKIILDAADKAGTVFQVLEQYRRTPGHRAMNWSLKRGEIGDTRMFFWLDVGERNFYWNWREHRSEAGGGWVLDGGVHYADLMRYHVGEIKSVACEVRAFDPIRFKKAETREEPIKVDVEDTVISNLVYENGAVGQWTSVSCAPGKGFSQHVIYGSEGSMDLGAGLTLRGKELETIDQLVERWKNSISKDEYEFFFPCGVTSCEATELWEFGQAVQGKMPIEITGMEAYKDVAICFALYESNALGGKPVSVADVEADKLNAYQKDLNEMLGI